MPQARRGSGRSASLPMHGAAAWQQHRPRSPCSRAAHAAQIMAMEALVCLDVAHNKIQVRESTAAAGGRKRWRGRCS
jgi:hypothetical protein